LISSLVQSNNEIAFAMLVKVKDNRAKMLRHLTDFDKYFIFSSLP